MSKKAQPPTTNFTFLTEGTIRRHHIEITRHQSVQLRAKLPKGIYWLQIEKRGLIQWNWVLLQSWMLHGEQSTEHQALLAEYMDTLPKSA